MPLTNHIFFADDSIFFCKADLDTNRKIQKVLTYEKSLGQKINMEKTVRVFSRNVIGDLKSKLSAL